MDDYVQRQAAKDAQAARDYAALAPSLSPEVRAVLADKHGRIRADDGYIGNHTAHDISEIPIAAPPHDMADEIDTLADVLAETFDLTGGQAAGIVKWHQQRVKIEADKGLAIRLARLIGALFRAPNLRLQLVALAFATDTASANGLVSMRKAAKEIIGLKGRPVSPAAVSKIANHWVGFLELPPSACMKSTAATRSYSAARKENHWRKSSKRLSKLLNRKNHTGT